MTKFRTALLTACATAALGGNANAAATATRIATNGPWETWQSTTVSGAPESCFIRVRSADGAYLHIGAGVGGNRFLLILASDSFAAKPAKKALDFQINGFQPWHAIDNEIITQDHSFIVTIPAASAREFVHELTAGTTIHLDYANGGTWDVPLAGTTPAWEAMMPCLKTTAPLAVAALPQAQPATQPFGATAFAPPTAPAPAPVASVAPVQPLAQLPLGTPGEAPITWNDGGYDIMVTLNGRPLNFTLDTGATAVVIPQNIADRLMADGSLTTADYLGPGTASLADGSQKTINRYKLRSVTVGGRTVSNVICNVDAPGSSLLLGQSFLLRFKSWSVDNARGVLVLGEPV
jgi:clan AA aspartic protease (TIGR02281 family)